jgi:hypothetical protein
MNGGRKKETINWSGSARIQYIQNVLRKVNYEHAHLYTLAYLRGDRMGVLPLSSLLFCSFSAGIMIFGKQARVSTICHILIYLLAGFAGSDIVIVM